MGGEKERGRKGGKRERKGTERSGETYSYSPNKGCLFLTELLVVYSLDLNEITKA